MRCPDSPFLIMQAKICLIHGGDLLQCNRQRSIPMSPVVRIPEESYQRLQKLATPFVDSPASVIDRLLDFYEKKNGVAKPAVVQTVEPPKATKELARSGVSRHPDYSAAHPESQRLHDRFVNMLVDG